jgi:chromosome segregation ATPase
MKTFIVSAAFLLSGALLAQEPRDLDILRARLKEVEEKLKAAKEEGRGDEREKLDQALLDLKAQILKVNEAGEAGKEEKGRPEGQKRREGRPAEGDSAHSMDLIEKIAQLRREAIRAKREGNMEKAKATWAEADNLDAELKLDPELRGAEGEQFLAAERQARANELREKAEAIARKGREAAEKMRRRAEDLREKARALARDGNPKEAQEDLRREAEKMQEEAEAIARDHREKAEEMRREAEKMARDFRGKDGGFRFGLREGGPSKPPSPPRPDYAQRPAPHGPDGPPPDDLRREVERLRSEVRELRDLLKRSLEERPAREPDKRNFR